MIKHWTINQIYQDKGEKNLGDEFTSAFRISLEQNWGIANSSGIRVLTGGLGGIKKYNRGYSCVIFISTLINTSWENPWDDSLDNDGVLRYWGDAKYDPKKDILDWRGNNTLNKLYDKVISKEKSMISPILYFQRQNQGEVIFKGLFKIFDLKTESYKMKNISKFVPNIRAYCKLLTHNKINQKWIIERARSGMDIPNLTPISWIKYLNSI